MKSYQEIFLKELRMSIKPSVTKHNRSGDLELKVGSLNTKEERCPPEVNVHTLGRKTKHDDERTYEVWAIFTPLNEGSRDFVWW